MAAAATRKCNNDEGVVKYVSCRKKALQQHSTPRNPETVSFDVLAGTLAAPPVVIDAAKPCYSTDVGTWRPVDGPRSKAVILIRGKVVVFTGLRWLNRRQRQTTMHPATLNICQTAAQQSNQPAANAVVPHHRRRPRVR
jgi:hypothetical protein